jgi:Hsp70 protein
VSFSDNERLIGDAAKNQVAMNPLNTYAISHYEDISFFNDSDGLLFSVFDAKRLIGRKFDDIEVQADIKHFPFKVINRDGKPYISVEYRGEQKTFVRTHFAMLIVASHNVLCLVPGRNLVNGAPEDEGDCGGLSRRYLQ